MISTTFQAVLEGGAFTEALASLEDWLEAEAEAGEERRRKGTVGDVDTVGLARKFEF